MPIVAGRGGARNPWALAESAAMTPQELARNADTAGLRLVRFLWCGNDGTIRAKASSRYGLEGRLERGIGVTRAMQAMNSLDQLQPVEGMGPVGEYRLVPGPRHVPGAAVRAQDRRAAHRPSAARREPGARCASARSSSACRRGWRERGLSCGPRSRTSSRSRARSRATYTPVDSGLCFSTIAMARVADVRRRARRGARGAADPARAVLRRARPRPAGDLDRARARRAGRGRAAVRARDDPRRGAAEGARGLARAEAVGRRTPATARTCTSRCGRASATASTPSGGLSELARAFLAGVLAHLPGLCGLTAPSFQSYQRIAPGMWAGAYTCWGYDNREAPVRVPSAVPRRGGGVDQRRAQGRATRAATRTSRSAGSSPPGSTGSSAS